MVVAWSGGVAAQADVVGAVSLEVGATAAFIAGQESGSGMTTGGARNQGWDWTGGGGRGTLQRGSFIFHKGSSDLGSKSR